jgi:tRNA (guanine10-N2)-dimethyltransferase
VAKLFFLLSGELESLPASELEAILEAEGYDYTNLEKLDQVVRLEADLACVDALKRRAAFTRFCGLELFSCRAEKRVIEKTANRANLTAMLGENESFAVRVKHIKEHSSEMSGMTLEKRLGAIVRRKTRKTKVNLENPDKMLKGFLTDGRFIFGMKLAEIPASPFAERRPRKKPFFHPSAMQAKLARGMVNLVRAKSGDLLLDPFCGTGTTLIEASLIGCRVLGLDIQPRMVKGTLNNMSYFKIKPEGIVVADAQQLPLTKVDCIVTDPPYGTSSTTMKRTTRQVVEEILRAVGGLLSKEQRVCIAAPKKLGVSEIGTKLGYRHLESHFVYVHRSLTREVNVFGKV